MKRSLALPDEAISQRLEQHGTYALTTARTSARIGFLQAAIFEINRFGKLVLGAQDSGEDGDGAGEAAAVE